VACPWMYINAKNPDNLTSCHLKIMWAANVHMCQ
jgi:hypothetical protein